MRMSKCASEQGGSGRHGPRAQGGAAATWWRWGGPSHGSNPTFFLAASSRKKAGACRCPPPQVTRTARWATRAHCLGEAQCASSATQPHCARRARVCAWRARNVKAFLEGAGWHWHGTHPLHKRGCLPVFCAPQLAQGRVALQAARGSHCRGCPSRAPILQAQETGEWSMWVAPLPVVSLVKDWEGVVGDPAGALCMQQHPLSRTVRSMRPLIKLAMRAFTRMIMT